jgi:hypothetical protein
VGSLQQNPLARQSDLFVFSDGPKNDSTVEAVQAVRNFLGTIAGFKSVTIIERERNLGLAVSVISGVTHVCQEFGRAIVLEDDLLIAPDFLGFMNCALERFAGESRVFSVSGFNYALKAPRTYSFDAFFTYRSSSWGWGTWRDRWAKADWSVSDYAYFCSRRNLQQSFNRGGEDLSRMLALQMEGRIDSWSIRWDYAHFKHNALALYPVVSRIYNIGFDGSGIHCRRAAHKQPPLIAPTRANYCFPQDVEISAEFTSEIRRLHRISLAKRLVHYLRDQAGWK